MPLFVENNSGNQRVIFSWLFHLSNIREMLTKYFLSENCISVHSIGVYNWVPLITHIV